MPRELGTPLMVLGALLLVVGLLVRTGALSWLGRLPGDVRWQGEHGAFYFPVTTMILISVVLSLLLWLFGPRG